MLKVIRELQNFRPLPLVSIGIPLSFFFLFGQPLLWLLKPDFSVLKLQLR